MNIRLICTGRLKKPYLEEAQREYVRLLSRFCHIEILEIREEAPKGSGAKAEEAAREAEGARITEKLEGYVVVMDPHGKRMTSEVFSGFLEELYERGAALSFVIGGSTGLAASVKQRADLLLSMSDMTMPHHLFRIVLLEQIFRAFKIARGETYHK